MADIYLRSTDGSDASDGLTWANAKATLTGALAACGSGGTVYVSAVHAETSGVGITWNSPGTAAAPVRIMCVDDTGDPEPPTAKATTGMITTTTSNDSLVFGSGFAYIYGLTFDVSVSGAIQFQQSGWQMESCVLDVNQGPITFGAASTTAIASRFVLVNCTYVIANTAQGFLVNGGFTEIYGGSLSGSSGALVGLVLAEGQGAIEIRGMDISHLNTGEALVDVDTTANANTVRFVDCKLGSGVSIAQGTFAGPASTLIEVINCDSADTNYRFHRQNYQATETQETTIVRSGGASDGTTTFSRKVVTTANVTPHFPYVSQWIADLAGWTTATGGALTATVEIITDNVTLTDAEIWLEIEYMGTSGFPLSLFANDRVSDLDFGTPANQTTSAATWDTTGLGTPVTQKLVVTFTPQEKGWIRGRIWITDPSLTVYYDPKLTVA